MSDAPESGAETSLSATPEITATPQAAAPLSPAPIPAGAPLSAAPILPAPMTLYVCTTCRGTDEGIGFAGMRAGARLHAALAAALDDPMVTVEAVECLSVCKRICTVAFAAPGKWTYVYGGLPADSAATILEGARLYAEAKHGLIPWKLRPEPLKTGVVSRVPPLGRSLEPAA